MLGLDPVHAPQRRAYVQFLVIKVLEKPFAQHLQGVDSAAAHRVAIDLREDVGALFNRINKSDCCGDRFSLSTTARIPDSLRGLGKGGIFQLW